VVAVRRCAAAPRKHPSRPPADLRARRMRSAALATPLLAIRRRVRPRPARESAGGRAGVEAWARSTGIVHHRRDRRPAHGPPAALARRSEALERAPPQWGLSAELPPLQDTRHEQGRAGPPRLTLTTPSSRTRSVRRTANGALRSRARVPDGSLQLDGPPHAARAARLEQTADRCLRVGSTGTIGPQDKESRLPSAPA
jgi:hypothetical protein